MHYDATFKGDSLLSLLILNTLNMGLDRISKHQKIVSSKYIYNKDGTYKGYEKIWNIPKIITSDVTFQLHFGFTYPNDNFRIKKVGQTYSLPERIRKWLHI